MNRGFHHKKHQHLRNPTATLSTNVSRHGTLAKVDTACFLAGRTEGLPGGWGDWKSMGNPWEIRGKHIMDIVEIGHMNSIHSQHPHNVAPPSRDVNVGLVSPHEY